MKNKYWKTKQSKPETVRFMYQQRNITEVINRNTHKTLVHFDQLKKSIKTKEPLQIENDREENFETNLQYKEENESIDLSENI